jgi:phosphoserine phosphatase
MRIINYFVLVLVLILLVPGCTPVQQDQTTSQLPSSDKTSDPLPSWNEGDIKSTIINFVKDVTQEGSPHFVPVPDRIAVFDNDGNLWSEKPVYFQMFFAMDRIREMAPDHPEWKTQQPFQAILEGDMEALSSYGEKGILELVMTTHTGMTTEKFEQIVKDWLSTARHPRFNRTYTELIYQPMVELMNYLREHEFKTFIVSGGGLDFMRPWVEETYGIPRNQVVGSSIKTEFVVENGKPRIVRLPEIDFINDKEGKPIGIHKFIGLKPIICSGNSDGDLQMMQWTASGLGKRMMIYLHHTDSVREWAYDRESPVGRLDKGLDVAIEKGWTVISMKDDWKVVYPFEIN